MTDTPQVEEVPTSSDQLVIRSDFPNCEPRSLFDYWVKSDLLTQWWPQEAEIDGRDGGAYHLSWPSMNWNLRGEYLIFDPGKTLQFTWKWDTDPPDVPHPTVSLSFEPIFNGGTRLTLTHAPYDDSLESQEARTGHQEGWTYFLTKLHGVRK